MWKKDTLVGIITVTDFLDFFATLARPDAKKFSFLEVELLPFCFFTWVLLLLEGNTSVIFVP
ncbi:MAG: hypothetical protein M5U34_29760 [Chloroflexi bacterium]|nr:hypothetical protein [Chloroflexota bacterium]